MGEHFICLSQILVSCYAPESYFFQTSCVISFLKEFPPSSSQILSIFFHNCKKHQEIFFISVQSLILSSPILPTLLPVIAGTDFTFTWNWLYFCTQPYPFLPHPPHSPTSDSWHRFHFYMQLVIFLYSA